MAHIRTWQAEVSYPGGTFIFGVRASSAPRAILKASQIAGKIPAAAGLIAITRLYGRHHPFQADHGPVQ